MVEFTPSIILFYVPPIPGIVSASIIFPFTYMFTEYLYYIHAPCPFYPSSPLLLVPISPGRTFSTLLFFDFINEEKNDIFVCLR
jgi:hypothetical protein